MSMQRVESENLLKHYFQNANHANVGDGTGLVQSTVPGDFFVSLHSADPGETGDQTTSEIVYTGYARESVARSAGGWAVGTGASPAVCDNVAAITFGACTALSDTALYWGIGNAVSGAGQLLFSALITSPGGGLAVSAGITPEFPIGDLDVTLE